MNTITQSPNHLPIRLHTHPPTHSRPPTQPHPLTLTYTATHPPIQPSAHLSTHPPTLTHPSTHPPTQPPTHPPTHAHLFALPHVYVPTATYSFSAPLIHPPTHPPTHSTTHSNTPHPHLPTHMPHMSTATCSFSAPLWTIGGTRGESSFVLRGQPLSSLTGRSGHGLLSGISKFKRSTAFCSAKHCPVFYFRKYVPWLFCFLLQVTGFTRL
jgi:hypothetical protein